MYHCRVSLFQILSLPNSLSSKFCFFQILSLPKFSLFQILSLPNSLSPNFSLFQVVFLPGRPLSPKFSISQVLHLPILRSPKIFQISHAISDSLSPKISQILYSTRIMKYLIHVSSTKSINAYIVPPCFQNFQYYGNAPFLFWR